LIEEKDKQSRLKGKLLFGSGAIPNKKKIVAAHNRGNERRENASIVRGDQAQSDLST